MEIIGAFLLIVAIILVIVSVINMIEGEWGYATVALIVAIVSAGFGVWFIKSDEQNDEQEMKIICSEYRVTQQTSILIENGDTVETTKYIIYYK